MAKCLWNRYHAIISFFFFLREETELLNTKLNKNYKKLWLAERQEINLDSINTISFLKCV